MITLDELAAARGRADEAGDVEIFDAALRRAQTLEPHVRALLEQALVLVGRVQSDPEYQAALYPYDTASQADQMARAQSGCGLVTEACWRAAGIDDKRLHLSYAARLPRKLYAVTLEKMIAEEHGAWADGVVARADLGELIEPGDALIIGCKSCRGEWSRASANLEHELVVLFTERAEDGSLLVHSVDGGQPHVAIRTRRYVDVPLPRAEAWLADRAASIMSDGRPSKGRRLLGFSRARLLPVAAVAAPPDPIA